MSSALTIYNDTFGLRERPFTLLPDPDFLFWSENHTRAYAMLEYGMLTRSPITVITGEIGAGKTTLVRHLLRSLPEEFTVGLISNARSKRGELLHWVLMALGVPTVSNASYVNLFARFQDFLIEEYASGRHTMLIFDEAQNLSVETLEELRMFSNINADKDELIQLVLVGQPELREMIRRPEPGSSPSGSPPTTICRRCRPRRWRTISAIASRWRGPSARSSRRRPASACIWPRAACRGSLTSSVIMLSSMPSPTASTRSMPPWSSRS